MIDGLGRKAGLPVAINELGALQQICSELHNKYVMCWAACRQLNTVPDKIRATDINPSNLFTSTKKILLLLLYLLDTVDRHQTFQNIFFFKLKEKPECCVE